MPYRFTTDTARTILSDRYSVQCMGECECNNGITSCDAMMACDKPITHKCAHVVQSMPLNSCCPVYECSSCGKNAYYKTSKTCKNLEVRHLDTNLLCNKFELCPEEIAVNALPKPVQAKEALTVCPQDMFQCADTSFVNRDINNGCQFKTCVNDKVVCKAEVNQCV
jgi:hypothetical protein